MICEYCNSEHDGSYGSGRFCCSECARFYSRSKVDDNELKDGKCSFCGKSIKIKKRASSKQVKCDKCRKQKNTSSKPQKYPLEDIFDGKHPSYNSHRLKLRLLKEGYKDSKCEKCGLEEWQGQPINLILDHIDGNNWNNSFDNLMLLCPNCNSLTDYNAGKNKRVRKGEISDEIFLQHLKKSDNIHQAILSLGLNPNGRGNYSRAYNLLKKYSI